MRIYYHKDLYSKDTLLKAAYHFTDNYYVYLGLENDCYFVDFNSKTEASIVEEELQNQFKNEILAQMIHQTVSNETADLRKILVARALSSTMIDEEEPMNEVSFQEVASSVNMEELSAIARDWFDGK